MKELTIGEMESISGGFNVFGSIANSISSIINNTAAI
ncbi:colicin V [Klebsiella michiganensis]|nr:colicin V [Klebsiella michiganensis]